MECTNALSTVGVRTVRFETSFPSIGRHMFFSSPPIVYTALRYDFHVSQLYISPAQDSDDACCAGPPYHSAPFTINRETELSYSSPLCLFIVHHLHIGHHIPFCWSNLYSP